MKEQPAYTWRGTHMEVQEVLKQLGRLKTSDVIYNCIVVFKLLETYDELIRLLY